MNDDIIAKIDSVFETSGMEAGLKYEISLNLSLDKTVEDSLWQLQWKNDLKNHFILRSIFDKYGFLPKELLGDHHYIQIVLLMHPPAYWNIKNYRKTYSDLLLEEVKQGRMSAKTYAQFYDNISGKILQEPQLYGTNMQYDLKTSKILPPIIEDINKTNKARESIGLLPLKVGEYRIQTNE